MKREKGELLTFEGEPAQREVFTVLQRLDQNQNKYKLFLDKEKFKANLADWGKAPVIFAKEHPKLNKARENLEAALKEVGGRLLGYPTAVKLESAGTPRLTANLPLDAETQALRDKGALWHSPSYGADDDGLKLTSDVEPDHILVYEKTPAHPMGDPGAMMFQGATSMTPEEQAQMKQYQTEAADAKKALQEVEAKAKNFAEEKVRLEAAAAESAKKLKDFQDAEAKAKAESEFKTFISHAPKGWTEGKVKVKENDKEVEVEKIDILRKDFQADPKAVYEKLLKFNEEHKDGSGDGEGQEHTGGAAPSRAHTIGSWNEKERRYEME